MEALLLKDHPSLSSTLQILQKYQAFFCVVSNSNTKASFHLCPPSQHPLKSQLNLPSAMALQLTFSLFVTLLSLLQPCQPTADTQSNFLSLMKSTLSGNAALSTWDALGYCNCSGISCNSLGHVTKIEISGWSLSGHFPPHVCSYLPRLQVLDISSNNIRGGFPRGIVNCSQLQVLNLSSLHLTGPLPNLSGMTHLRVLELSFNHFGGGFPASIANLTTLEALNLNQNHFSSWQLPHNISRLENLKRMILTNCNLHGLIPPSIGQMTSLTDLELCGNSLVGPIPPVIGRLKNLKMLMLYGNQLTGSVPEELGNLTELTELDMSANQLSGNIPSTICRLPKLHTLQLFNNSLTGPIPEALGDSRTLSFLSLYDNHLTGTVPASLGRLSPMLLLELSDNRLSGQLPPFICAAGKLLYLLVLGNTLTGEIPAAYANCTSLLRFRVSSNGLQGSVPAKLFSLPHASIIDLAFNHLSGPLPKTIASAKNLTELFIQGNRISGVVPPEIAGAVNLVKVDASSNLLSGPVPSGIGSLRKLNLLLLQGNNFNSSIPNSLCSLRSLNLLDLSNNQFTGSIPDCLAQLLPNAVNLSYNQLSGAIPLLFTRGRQEESFFGNPDLCVSTYLSSDITFPVCSQSQQTSKLKIAWVIMALLVVVFLGIILFLRRCLWKGKAAAVGQDETVSPSCCSYDIKSFHQISFEQREIVEAMVGKNIVGHGGCGTVYRIGLSSGEVVAVKKLWRQNAKDCGSETEVETLGRIRHKNIVKLYSCLSSWNSQLLVYEYMQNGNLWDALHKGKILVDWPARRQVALGVARGLAYLHHDLLPPIIHRDIKSSNILLDADYHPKVADFGVAKVLRAGQSTTAVIAGTYGYLDPDYVNSSKATTKCDVYSFGVVLMELVTGKKPIEAEFGEDKNIVNWMASKVDTKEGAVQVLDKRLSASFKDEMLAVLWIAMRCTARAPAPRPTMTQVVPLLIEACFILSSQEKRMEMHQMATQTGKNTSHFTRDILC